MKMAKPLLESFGAPQGSAQQIPAVRGTSKEKETHICHLFGQTIVALSLCFKHLVLSTFWQCRSAIPKRSAKPIAIIHHTVQCPRSNPYLN